MRTQNYCQKNNFLFYLITMTDLQLEICKKIYPTVANLQAHYINMCEKTEEEKVIYFLDNAIIPWISK